MARILIIDDDRGVRKYLTMVLEKPGHTISSSPLLNEGIRKCETERFDIVLLDVHLPDGNGLEALPLVQNSVGRPEVIIITGEGDPDSAELAIKSGAWDYIEKPLLIDSILLPVKRAILYHSEKQATETLGSFNRQNIIGKSPQISESFLLASRAAKSTSNTLITGETGTGKELFAQAIHRNSPRWQENLVVVDCTALPENLVESILFGHVKGAFTGADRNRTGLVRSAHRGTLFLDEVGELPLSTQKTFLRVVQEKKFRVVGSKQEQESDFCLISATNRNPDTLVKQGKFRQDLLFRLRTIHIELPPLRNRGGDLRLIASHFANKYCESNGLPVKILSDEFLAAICSYNWPGNVRELISALENVLSVAKNSPILYPEHLPTTIRAKIAKFSIKPYEQPHKPCKTTPETAENNLKLYKEYRENIFLQAEKPYLINLMVATDWNIEEACTISGLSRSRLYALLKKHDITRTNTCPP